MTIDKKAIFHLVLGFLPGHLGTAARMAEDALTTGKDRKAKVVGTAIAAMVGLKAFADVSKNPKVIAAVEKANDALIEAANTIAAIAAAEAEQETAPAPVAPVD